MPNVNLSDYALIRLIQGGGREAYGILFNQYYSPLCAYAVTILKFTETAEDVVQETFIKLWEARANARFNIEILDADHGFALRDWQKMGSPEPPNREETRYLQDKALDTLKMQLTSDSTGTLHWDVKLTPWSVVLLMEAT